MYEDFKETNLIWTWKKSENGYFYDKYFVDGMIFGDTDSGGFRLPELVAETEDIDLICEFADTVGKLANESFPDFVKNVFNCPEERQHIIQTDREVVSDKSLFLTKKRYIMHMVDKEGVRIDKLKIMGVEIKKSGTSVFLKQALIDLVNKILDGESREQVHKWSVNLRKELENAQIKDIYTPISTKTLKKCQNIYDMTGDMKGFPWQVRAAMFYNSLCGDKDQTIKPGDKVGIIYIKHHKSKYIALPIDAVCLPDWVDKIVVDYNTTWNKIYKKIVNYITVLGWDYQTRKEELQKDLFGF